MAEIDKKFQVVVIGAGAAGLMAAITAAKRGRKVLILEKNDRVGKKILISGGGRCNFTNLNCDYKNYASSTDSRFVKYALAEYPPEKFIELIKKHNIKFHEKHRGQLFCNTSSKEIANLLIYEAKKAGVEIRLNSEVIKIEKISDGNLVYLVYTKNEIERKKFAAESIIVASGGLSFPQLGVSDVAYQIAETFKHSLIPIQPGLVPFTLKGNDLQVCETLAGVALPVIIRTKDATTKRVSFEEDLLFTHKGISGPAVLQISLHWQVGHSVHVNLVPNVELLENLIRKKSSNPKILVKTALKDYLPSRVATELTRIHLKNSDLSLGDTKNKELSKLVENIQNWSFIPDGTEGFAKAEVTRGGVSTSNLSEKNLESKLEPGLFFIGEAVDVTGWLGGYNFQWAWASGVLAGKNC